MSDNHADQLDGEKLGEGVGDDGLPGIGDYPPDTAQGVDDPNLVAPDDVAMREARTRGEAIPVPDGGIGDVLPPDGDDGAHDDVQQLLAREGTADDDAPTPAEVAALRVTDDSSE